MVQATGFCGVWRRTPLSCCGVSLWRSRRPLVPIFVPGVSKRMSAHHGARLRTARDTWVARRPADRQPPFPPGLGLISNK